MPDTPVDSPSLDPTSRHRVDVGDQARGCAGSGASVLDAIFEHGPSPEAMIALSELDPGGLDGFDRVRVVQAWEAARGWIEARGLTALLAVAGERPVEVDDWVREEVAAALTLSGPAAQGRIDVARACVTRLSTAVTALAAGRLSYLHVRALAAETVDLTDREAAAVCDRVVARGSRQTLGRWRVTIRRAIHQITPTTVEDAHARACEGRKVQFWELPHGMAALYAELPAPDALTVWNAINLIARRTPDPVDPSDPDATKLGVDARRADGLVELATRYLADPDTPTAQGRSVELQVMIDLPTLFGLRHDGVAEMVGYGPIPTSVARQLAADARWRRLVTDPVDGHLLDYATTTYTPPAKLRDYIINRDRTCRHPGCRAPAHRNDIDHAQPFPKTEGEQGGPTSAANCGSLCRRHHRLKTLGHWTLTSHPNGSAIWTSPTGHTYNTRPGPSP